MRMGVENGEWRFQNGDWGMENGDGVEWRGFLLFVKETREKKRNYSHCISRRYVLCKHLKESFITRLGRRIT